MPNRKRAYDKLQIIVEKHRGQMVWRKQGYKHGAWEISLDGNLAISKGTGAKSFPELDRFFVPLIPEPTTWDDYKPELIPDAEQQFLAWIAQAGKTSIHGK